MFYWTEFFRVHAVSHLEKWILKSITENPTGRPIVAQLIGNDIPVARVRGEEESCSNYSVAAIGPEPSAVPRRSFIANARGGGSFARATKD